eukprot:TRINITY_DN5569_c0_g1_i1.p1 TRINITY_DN5569_c0_g1~~TRINITY_DN5569_c0_g1_i1.p1  ORF type:complete len:397 (+),score=50.28 TRINITY_DN5569_c0_g1_i1:225-1415(+)
MGVCCSTQEDFRGALLYIDKDMNKGPLHPNQYASEDMSIDRSKPPAILPERGFQVELGIPGLKLDDVTISLENQDRFSLFYRDNFSVRGVSSVALTPHINYIGGSVNDPVVISVQFNPSAKENYKVILRNKKFDTHLSIPHATSKSELLRQLYQAMPPLIQARLREVKKEEITKDLLYIEDRLLIRNYKFGVIYCKEGQVSENDMFSNREGSSEFEHFLGLLGDKVRLNGWKGFDGELDTKTDSTGTHSFYTEIEKFPVMFHVSTMLPYSDVNSQQIERKRHIGNDICCIIFMDSTSTPFSPSTITSHYNHVYAVVQLVSKKKKKRKYRVSFASKKGVIPHGPLIPKDGIFEGGPKFKEFLLTKLINAERAAYSAPSFGVTRTRANLLRDILQSYS